MTRLEFVCFLVRQIQIHKYKVRQIPKIPLLHELRPVQLGLCLVFVFVCIGKTPFQDPASNLLCVRLYENMFLLTGSQFADDWWYKHSLENSDSYFDKLQNCANSCKWMADNPRPTHCGWKIPMTITVFLWNCNQFAHFEQTNCFFFDLDTNLLVRFPNPLAFGTSQSQAGASSSIIGQKVFQFQKKNTFAQLLGKVAGK